MSRVVRHRQTQVGGACTPSERDELDQYLLDQTPRDALKALNDLQVTRRGNYEYILAIGRLYRQFQWMQAHGFPPEPSNVLWTHVESEADEMGLSSGDYIKKAMRHIQIRHGGYEYYRPRFEIQFLQKPALWWRQFYELMVALDDTFGAPLPLDVVKRVLTDTALDKLTNPQLVEELSAEHLVHARREVLRSYRENGQVSFVDFRTYDQLGLKIGKDGWIQQITPFIQQGRGRCAKNHKSAPPRNTELDTRDNTNNHAQSQRHGRGRGRNRALNPGPY